MNVSLVQDMLSHTAAAHPSRPAVLSAGGDLDFATLEARTDRTAAALLAMGVRVGDRVAVMGENSVALAIALLGVLRAGGVAVPIGGGVKGRRLAFVLGDSGARVILVDAECAAAVREAGQSGRAPAVVWMNGGPIGEPRLEEIVGGSDLVRAAEGTGRRSALTGSLDMIDQDLAAIIYTSGTTGQPKGVMLTHRNLVNSTGAITRYLRNTPEDVVACLLPLAYSYGLCQLLGAIRIGYAIAIERSFAFPADVLGRLALRGVTGLPALPSVFARIAQNPGAGWPAMPTLRYATNAADALPAAHVARLRELWPGVSLFSMYGQTECTRATYLDPTLIDRFPSSSGKAMPNCQAWVVDDRGRPAGVGVIGELVVRGSNLMRGYWNNPEATGRALREPVALPGGAAPQPGERVLHTGDLFTTDENGLLFFRGRVDDVFKCRGEKVSPREIESVLCELPEVAEAMVVGVPDAADGLAIKAIVVPRDGCEVSETRVRGHCKARLDGALMPRFVEVRSDLPRTASGKVDRGAVRREGASEPRA